MQTLSTLTRPVLGAQPTSPARVNAARTRLHATYRHLALWSLQGWLAMFFIAAGYTKVTQSADLLTILMGWPALVDLDLVRVLGVAEISLAVLSLAPLVSWRIGRPLLLGSAAALLALELAMMALHASRSEAGLAAVNAALVAITFPILLYRARAQEAQARPAFAR